MMGGGSKRAAVERATVPIQIENTGREELMIIKFFGPDINLDVPGIPRYGEWKGLAK